MTKPTLNLFNTLTREKKPFTPLDKTDVRLYVCGITPYDYAHIGNLRTMVVFDVLYRLLNHLYDGNVTYVRNYTDIDDKIVQRANESGKEPFALAAEFIEIFERDMAALNVLKPTHQPRVSEHLKGIVAMVNGLLEKGFAYITASGDVMFDVPAFEKLGSPHDKFGYLARRTFENTQARVEEDAEKNDPRDFPVWKANAKSETKLEQAFSPQELGATFPKFTAPGRPGWHIECSVMSQSLLAPHPTAGQPLFDIHGGGEDLAFPHHSCEIAQSEAFNPSCTMSSVWMHNAFLTVGGTKMSKSLNNFLTIEEARKKYSPEAIRLWLLQTHYRKPVDFSDEALASAEARIESYRNQSVYLASVNGLKKAGFNGEQIEKEVTIRASFAMFVPDFSALPVEFIEALSDDLNTSKALSIIDQSESGIEKLNMLSFLGIKLFNTSIEENLIERVTAGRSQSKSAQDILREIDEASFTTKENELLNAREIARKNKDWSESDRLRDILKSEYDILVEDGPNGQTKRRI